MLRGSSRTTVRWHEDQALKLNPKLVSKLLFIRKLTTNCSAAGKLEGGKNDLPLNDLLQALQARV
jgi:hypothetical protein